MSSCANCGSTSWENINQFRFKDTDKDGNKIDMCICTDCGFVSYPNKLIDKQKMIDFYKKEYRPAPTIFNSFTGQRKNYFHLDFLNNLFEKWKKEEKENPVICDIGCAYGMSINMFKQIFPDAEVSGVELTESMRRVAYHEFGFKLLYDIDSSKKYDMIMSYKVLEHQIDPISELKKYASLLKEDGVLYISVPTWFNSMNNFGLDGFDLETYYDPNHINVWTREMFESMLQKSGFEIIKKNHITYGDTYLCKVNKENTNMPILKHDINDIKSKMHSIKEAFNLFNDYKYKEAISLYKEYPQAWISYIEMERKKLTENGYDWFKENLLDKMIEACPNAAECLISATDFTMRAQLFDKALNLAVKSLQAKPNNPVSLEHIITIFKQIGARSQDEKTKIENFKKARNAAINLHNFSSQNREKAINEIYLLNSLIPIEE